MFDPDNYRRGDRDTQTLEQRVVELEYALPQVMPPPLLGYGLAAPYRPCLPLDTMKCSKPSYIHNGYVAILFNLGVLGFAAFIWILVSTTMAGLAARRAQVASSAPRLPRKGQPIARSFDAEAQRLAVACSFAFIGLVPALMLEPYMMLWPWTPVIALMIATVQLCKPTALAQPQVPKPQRLMPIMRANTEH
jgi:O-antigen ligase